MVLYWLLLSVLIVFLTWGLYKILKSLFLKEEPKTRTISEKQDELDRLKKKTDDLDQEVEVTEKLAKTDVEIKNLTDQLEEAENKRS